MIEGSVTEQLAVLGSALAIGLLIGMERGWKAREEREGARIAGLRTFGLIGLLGGGTGMLAAQWGVALFGMVFLGVAAAFIVAYALQRQRGGDISITSLVAAMLTFVLGGMATSGHVAVAAPAAVVAVVLLGWKEELHGWLKKLEKGELYAVLQLLLISVVLLPVLPNRGFGPWQALNPYEIWWMVVLIAGISFVGYFTMKIAGPGKGIVLTALAAGLATSTALTLQYANLARRQQELTGLLAVGILLACGTMFPRMLLVASLVNPDLFSVLVLPLGLMTALTWGSALLYWHRQAAQPALEVAKVSNPLELKPALYFGLLLALIILLGKAIMHWLGHPALYVLAAVSGIADVDPINLTLAKLSLQEISLKVAVTGIVLAASINTLLKGLLATSVGGAGLGKRLLIPMLVVAVSGLFSVWLLG